MADLTDVGNALVTLAAQTVYPNGTGQASLPGVPVKVYQGWPIPQQLDADLLAGTCHVSVFPRPDERNTTRHPKDWQPLSMNAPTLTATIAGQTVTIGGTIPLSSNPTNVMVEINGIPYVYAVQPSDTLTGVATALAMLIAVDVSGTTNSGAVITLPGTARISAARVGITGTAIREVRRQERVFMISIWADTPQHRDAVVQPIDFALASTTFLTLVDQMAARLIYKGTQVMDDAQKSKLYRRDLFYTVEYAMTEVTTATQVTQEAIGVAVTNAATTTINM